MNNADEVEIDVKHSNGSQKAEIIKQLIWSDNLMRHIVNMDLVIEIDQTNTCIL